jgi:flagellar basal body P-ring protein FlgI
VHTLTKLSRIAAIVALRATCLFGVGLVLGFAGFTASTMRSHVHLSALERSVQHPISGSLVESGQAQKGPHLVASSGQVFQVRFP